MDAKSPLQEPGDYETEQATSAALGAAVLPVIRADPGRICITFTMNGISDPAAGNESIQIGTGTGASFRPVCTLTVDCPNYVLSREEIGPLVCAAWNALSLTAGGTAAVSATSLRRVR